MLIEHAVENFVGVCSIGAGDGILKTDSARRGEVGGLSNLLRGSIVVVEGCFHSFSVLSFGPNIYGGVRTVGSQPVAVCIAAEASDVEWYASIE